MSSKNTVLTYVRHRSLKELAITWLDLGTYVPLDYGAPGCHVFFTCINHSKFSTRAQVCTCTLYL